ncbi:BTAD domain-containing putative transcriptional regulator [Nocardioides marmorisolisilvae]|uniref:OmpR/PhoB-type domain-containing protein n=1 Tax=Nocardioides marmorisolisilvae TaxID=1542737 RepID=A0A3N0DNU9_9ACTN|nr:BTAD domain-containing putative transcriptional regulator [Nocardioides marmorisolisilvae]RNL77322.1 hypothetical protein EFL95_17880 [Nocardioides marmorisolisilvae]
MLNVRVLGPVEVVHDGEAREISGAKERALLAVLASDLDRHFSVDSLVDELYRDSKVPDNAAAGVHVFVSRLRRQLGPAGGETLVRHGGGYSLALAEDALDSRVFLRTAGLGRELLQASDPDRAVLRLRDAVGLWRGRPFEGVSTQVTDLEADRLIEVRRSVFEALFEAELAAGRHREILAQLDQLIAEHPFHERFWAMRMVALYRSGRQAEALRNYQQLRAQTIDELGFEPTPELQRLELALLEHDPRLEWVPGVRRAETVLGLTGEGSAAVRDVLGPIACQPYLETSTARALVGRDAEQKVLAEVLDPEGPRRLRAVIVTGEAGAGKTRLVVGAALQAFAGGATVLVGRCDGYTLGAYQPVAEMVRWVLEQVPADELVAKVGEAAYGQLRHLALPHESEPVTSLYGDSNPNELYEAVAQLLRAVASPGRLVLVLEDAHWLDGPTSAMLRYLVRRFEADPISLLVTERPAEAAQYSPVLDVVDVLRRTNGLQEIVLGLLGPREVSSLAESILARPVTPSVAEALHVETSGNPLFVVEFLRHLVETGAIGSTAHEDEHDVVRTTSAPQSIRELVEQRLRRLDADAARLLTIGAALGREFDADIVRLVSGLDSISATRALDTAHATGLIDGVVDVPGRYTFTHAMIRRTVYDRLPSSERTALHLSIAETLEGHSLGTASQLARHYFESAAAGPPDRAIASGVRAAKEAQRALAFEDSLEILERTMKLVEARGSGRDRVALMLDLGDAHWWAGDVEQSQAIFADALELARVDGDDALFARAVLGRWRNNGAATQGFSASAPDRDLMDMIEEALSGLTEDAALRAALLGRLGIASYWTTPLERRREIADSAVALARASGNEAVLLDVLVDRQLTLWTPGSEAQRLERAQEILALARKLRQSAREADCRAFEAVDHLALGDTQAADASIRHFLRASTYLRQPFYRWHAHYLPALRALMRGRFDEAESLTAAATDESELFQPGAEGAMMLTGLQTLWLFYERGDLDQIAPLLEGVADTFGEIPAMNAARAWVAAETGDRERASTMVAELAAADFDVIAQTDIAWLAAMCFISSAAATVGDLDAAARLRTILTPYVGRNGLVWVGLCCGPVDHYLGLLAARLGDQDAAAAHLDDAVALTERMDALPLRLRAQLDRCRVAFARAGDPYPVGEVLAEVRAAADRLGMRGVVREAESLQADLSS